MNNHTKRPFHKNLVLLLLTIVLGCTQPSTSQSTATSNSLAVATTSPMMTEFATRMLENTAKVQLIVPADRPSRDWRPTRTAATELRDANLVVLTGAGWEPWSERVSLAPTRTVDLSETIKQFLIEVPDAVTHQHGPDGAHSHKGFVPHTWLSPQLLLLQLPDLEAAMLKAHPASRDTIRAKPDNCAHHCNRWPASQPKSKRSCRDRKSTSSLMDRNSSTCCEIWESIRSVSAGR